MVGEYCEPQVTFEWVLGLPDKPKPFTIYFVKTNNIVEMWVANKDGQLTLINTSVNVPVHNSLAGLQGGQAGQYYHLTQAEYQNLNTIPSAQQTFDVFSKVIIVDDDIILKSSSGADSSTLGLTPLLAQLESKTVNITGEDSLDLVCDDHPKANSSYIVTNVNFNGSDNFADNTGKVVITGGGNQDLQQTVDNGSNATIISDSDYFIVTVKNTNETALGQLNIAQGIVALQAAGVSSFSSATVGINSVDFVANNVHSLLMDGVKTEFDNIAATYQRDLSSQMTTLEHIPSIRKVQAMIDSTPSTGVQTVTGYIVDNTDPLNPVIKLPSEGNSFYRTDKGYQWISGVRVPNTNQAVDEIGDWFTGTKDGNKYPVLRWNGGNKNLLTSYEGTAYFFFLPFSTEPDYE